MAVQVRMTRDLEARLRSSGLNPEEYINVFKIWKGRGGGQFDHAFFGKDTFYSRPRGTGNRHVLRHVHLAPENPQREDFDTAKEYSDAKRDYYNWESVFRYRSGRATSNTALVYVDGTPLYGYLLVAIFWDPDGHTIPEMKTGEHKTLMENLVVVAEDFIYHGRITM